MSDFIDRVKQGLLKLKQFDPFCEFDCSGYHQYKLNPVVDEDDILDFEDTYGCTLPDKYKEFLTQAGNGGAGPSYGILPLGMNYDGDWPDYIKPNKSFPFIEAFNDTSILTKGQPEISSYTNRKDYEKACDIWLDKYREEAFTSYCIAHSLDGAIPIVDHGCALSSWLVVAEGPEYGHIWEDYVADEEGVLPYGSKKQKRYTFDQWYLEWLENSLSKITRA